MIVEIISLFNPKLLLEHQYIVQYICLTFTITLDGLERRSPDYFQNIAQVFINISIGFFS